MTVRSSPYLAAKADRLKAGGFNLVMDNKVVQNPEIQTKLLDQAILARTNTPVQMAALVKTERVKWKKVIDAAGIQPQ